MNTFVRWMTWTIPYREFAELSRSAIRTAAVFMCALVLFADGSALQAQERPNILWITVEDMSPTLGCWGDPYADTPNLDKFAKESVRYTNAFATAPVCSPVRSCLITGMYATSLGTQSLRSTFSLPDSLRAVPSQVRELGYFTSNNVKTDYNTSSEHRLIEEAWDACSPNAHWRDRKAGSPFFSVFNDMTTHQSRTMVWSYEAFQKEVQSQLDPGRHHDPSTAPVPPYYPDTPVVRKTIARFYDCVSVMDQNVGKLLAQLEEDGLADNTIVFFYSDHGSGMPRHKRLLHDSGTRVPLLIRFPKKFQHLAPAEPGATLDRLVSFVDFPPTLLSLLGIKPPAYMQGGAFLGEHKVEEREYVYGARDRVDEAFDTARSVRDKRFLYIRNYLPSLSYNQPSAYSDLGEIRDEITGYAERSDMSSAQEHYAGASRAIEELYDTQTDPLNLNNLADSGEHEAMLSKFRALQREWSLETKDLGFIPETVVWQRAGSVAPLEYFGETEMNLEKVRQAADLVGMPNALAEQKRLLQDTDPAVRFWAVQGLKLKNENLNDLNSLLQDPSAAVRIAVAEAVLKHQTDSQAMRVLCDSLQSKDENEVLLAARALELLGERGRPALPFVKMARRKAMRDPSPIEVFIEFSTSMHLVQLGEMQDQETLAAFRK